MVRKVSGAADQILSNRRFAAESYSRQGFERCRLPPDQFSRAAANADRRSLFRVIIGDEVWQRGGARWGSGARSSPRLGRDEELMPILARTDRESSTVSSITFASKVPAMALPAGVIASAVLELVAQGEPLTIDSVLPLAQRNVAAMRRIAAGEPIDVLTVAGLTGFRLPDGGQVEVEAGFDSCDQLIRSGSSG